MKKEHITVLLADEHALYRDALATSLTGIQGITIVGQTGTGTQAATLFRKLRPDILIIDITMSSSKGLETSAQLLTEFPSAHIIWLSTFIRETYHRRARAEGIRGYVAKSMPYLQLIEAIHTVHEGKKYFTTIYQ